MPADCAPPTILPMLKRLCQHDPTDCHPRPDSRGAVHSTKAVSAARTAMHFGKEVVLPVLRLITQDAQLMHLLGVDEGTLRRNGELHLRVLQDPLEEVPIQAGVLLANIDFHRLVRIAFYKGFG